MDTASLTKEAKMYNGEKTVSSISSAGKLGQTCERMKLEHSLNHIQKETQNGFKT